MPFPINGLLDNFNRADESPLSQSGNWSSVIIANTVGFDLVSNAILGSNTFSASSYRSNTTYGPGAECYISIPTLWINNNSDFWLWIQGSNENTGSVSGYFLYIFQTSGAFTWRLYRKDNGVDTQLGADISTQTLANGDSVGLQCSPSGVFQAWYKASGGSWATTGTTRSDTTYTSGHIGLSKGFADVTSRLDDFGGGNVTATVVDSDDYELPVVVFS